MSKLGTNEYNSSLYDSLSDFTFDVLLQILKARGRLKLDEKISKPASYHDSNDSILNKNSELTVQLRSQPKPVDFHSTRHRSEIVQVRPESQMHIQLENSILRRFSTSFDLFKIFTDHNSSGSPFSDNPLRFNSAEAQILLKKRSHTSKIKTNSCSLR